MSIAITGASGQLGHLIIEGLLRRIPAEWILACVRRPDASGWFEERGVSVRPCDYDQPDALEQAFAGVSRLLLISSSHQDDTVRLRQHAHVIEAAKKAKVGHLLYTSFAYADYGSVPLAHLHLATEQAILASGIPYTFLRNALYTDIVGALGLPGAIAQGELVVRSGDWTFNTVTRPDLAEAAAAVLANSEAHLNRSYELTASRTWTFEDLADVLAEIAGKPITLRRDPEVQSWIYGFLSRIDTSSVSVDLERLLGRPTTSLLESIQPMVSRERD
jgi:Predicted nucleoside-diphosphate-sugar epimerases